MNDASERVYEFGDFRLVPREKHVLFRGTPVPLPPKVFDTLVVLVERSGTLVEKDELLKCLWPDTFVEDVALAHNISLLRKALRGVADGDFIETVPKRGYRFLPTVRQVSPGQGFARVAEPALEPVAPVPTAPPHLATAAPTPARMHAQGRKLLFVSCAAITVAAIVGVGVSRIPAHVDATTSIGILPFAVAATDDGVTHLGTGLADALIVRLHQVRHVAVRPASSVASFDPAARDPVKLRKGTPR
jgi:DNA-binding winged helix-turn-helix (wHTH) protein